MQTIAADRKAGRNRPVGDGPPVRSRRPGDRSPTATSPVARCRMPLSQLPTDSLRTIPAKSPRQNTNLRPNCIRRIGTVTGFTLVEPAKPFIEPAFGTVMLLTGGPRLV